MTVSIREALTKAAGAGREEEVEAAPSMDAEAESAMPAAEVVSAEDAPTLADKESNPVESAPATGRDDKGRFAPKPKAAVAQAGPVKPGQKPAEMAKPAVPKAAAVSAVAAQPATAAAPTAPVAIKAPQSWKADIREKFASLPPEVQQEIDRVEREVKNVQRETASVRKTAEEFSRVLAPFEPLIRASGSDPLKTVGNLLQTAHALHTAPPARKAQMVAQIISDYGVDVKTLDTILAGEAPPQAQQQPQQFKDPRFDQFIQTLEQRKAQAQQAEFQRVQSEAEAFAQKAEFFEDVREDVADILEMAHRRKLPMTLEQAYNRAVQMHPEVSEVLRQRQAAQSAANAQASTQRARAAASSVKGQPAGPQSGDKPKSIRGAIEAAYAAHSGQR